MGFSRIFGIYLCAALAWGGLASAGDRLLLQSTTSTQNSGLYDHLLPLLEAETGIDVQVVAVGTGQALRNARNGDADILLVHAKSAEEAFVADGFGIARHDLMYNDFVVIGPATDPADLLTAPTVFDALRRIASGGERFVSRGDDSGTHKKELSLWQSAGVKPARTAYLESGSGMGATLRMAIELQGYTLSDRATWLAFNGKADAQVVFEGDPPLHNQYGIIIVNPDRHPHVNLTAAERFLDWMLGEPGRSAIAAFRVNDTQLFFPNAGE